MTQKSPARPNRLYNPGDRERLVAESERPDSDWHGSFRRDYSRVIHSAGFRRLQGKTQLFPTQEIDFFRNRLTHSLEVAQIAEGIADRLNATEPKLQSDPIIGRICATAGLVHDIGHPPFGHNGERALDQRMKESGGFEGNAQTLRILACLEKKMLVNDGGKEVRRGLNLTARTLAAILKYDSKIPKKRDASSGLSKGYYYSEEKIVKSINKEGDWSRF